MSRKTKPLPPPPSLGQLGVLRLLLQAGVAVARADTAWEPEQAEWTEKKPLMGHCGAMAYVVQQYLGGDVVSARDEEGSRWIYNRLPGDTEVALTYRDPFFPPGSRSARYMGESNSIARKITLGRNKRFDIFFERVRAYFETEGHRAQS